MESVSIYVISQWISVSIDVHIYNTSFAEYCVCNRLQVY